jgi:PAS domain S-box-containing protein
MAMRRAPRRAPRLAAVRGPQRPFWWGRFAVLASVGLCLGVLWLHALQARAITRSETILGSVRNARADLSQGFLHVMLSDSAGIPFQREQGFALLRQAVEALRRPLVMHERGDAASPAHSRIVMLDRQVQAFFSLLRAWDQAGGRERNDLEGRLRVAFHQLELTAEQLDLGQRVELAAVSRQLDRRFDAAVIVAALLSLVLYVSIVSSHRHQRRTARALDESDAHLRMVGDNLPDSYVYQCELAPSGVTRFTYVSAGIARVHGITPQEIMQDPQALGAQLDEESARVFQQAAERSASSLADFRLELPFQCGDGEVRVVEMRSRPRRTADGRVYWEGIATNVSEQRRMEGAVQSAEQRFEELAEAIEEVFWMTDVAKQRMLYVSPAYERIWGQQLTELYANPTSWVESIHIDDRERVVRAAREQQVIGTYDETYRIVRADGAIRWIRDRAFPVAGPDGAVQRVVGTAQDVTEQRILEDQFRQAQKMEAVGQLAGGVAHDFNNILAAMIIQVELALMADGAPEEVRRDLVEIGQSVDRAKSLTRQLLAFSRRQVMRVEDVDLNQVVTGFSGLLDRLLGETVQLKVELMPGTLVAAADVGMLEQVLMNLAVNAKDAMPRGGELVIRTFTRDVCEVAPGGRIAGNVVEHVGFSVTDTGTGIAPDHLSRIFEPFFTTKPVGEGTGLGLASVFGIVSQHHGVVDVQSTPGQGTTFVVSLPMSRRPAPAQADAPPVQTPGPAHETILVAEDDQSVRSLLQIVLEHHGYQVLVAMNGVEALQVAHRHRGPIHLLLSDIVMPGTIDGFELCEQLRKNHPALRRLFMSGYGSEIGGCQLSLDEGEEVLTKPFTSAQLLETLRAELNGTRAVQARLPGTGDRPLAYAA